MIYANDDYMSLMDGIDCAEIVITSDADLRLGEAPDGAFVIQEVPGVGVVPGRAAGDKCERCYKVLPEVGKLSEHQTICERCADAVENFSAAAE